MAKAVISALASDRRQGRRKLTLKRSPDQRGKGISERPEQYQMGFKVHPVPKGRTRRGALGLSDNKMWGEFSSSSQCYVTIREHSKYRNFFPREKMEKCRPQVPLGLF